MTQGQVLLLALLVSVPLVSSVPEPAITVMAKGDYQYQSGDLAAAIISYQEALRLDPSLVETHYKLGRIFQSQQAWNLALYHFEELVKKSKTLTYIHLHLDALFDLSQTHFKIGESIDPGSIRNPHIKKMQDYLQDVIDALKPGGLIDSLGSQYIDISKDYYLARAWYILARIYEDKNQDHKYPEHYINAIRHLDKFRTQQKRAENIVRVAFRESECLYALYRHHRRIKEFKKAREWEGRARLIQKDLLAMAQTLERDPASSWSPDIAVYKAGARNIDLLFAGKVKIDPLFRFFPVK